MNRQFEDLSNLIEQSIINKDIENLSIQINQLLDLLKNSKLENKKPLYEKIITYEESLEELKREENLQKYDSVIHRGEKNLYDLKKQGVRLKGNTNMNYDLDRTGDLLLMLNNRMTTDKKIALIAVFLIVVLIFYIKVVK